MRYCILLLLLLSSTLPATEVYKWVDDNGQVHYGDRPADAAALPLDVTPRTSDPDPGRDARREKRERLLELYADEREARQAAAAEQARAAAEQQQRCNQAREQLQQYARAQYLYEDTGQGERHILSDTERAREEQQLHDYLARHCS